MYDRSGHPPNRPDLEFMGDCIDAMAARMRTGELGEDEAVVGAMLTLARICAITGMRDFDLLVGQLRLAFDACVLEAIEMGGTPKVDLDEEQAPAQYRPGEYRPGVIKQKVLSKLARLGVTVFAPGTKLADAQEQVGAILERASGAAEEVTAEAAGRRALADQKWGSPSIVATDEGHYFHAQVRCGLCCQAVISVHADREAAISGLQEKMVEHDVAHLQAQVARS